MSIPKQLMDLLRKEAMIELYKDGSEKPNSFLAGGERMFEHLCELSGREFDRYAAEEMIESIAESYPLGDYTVTGFDIDIARHQHTLDMAALLKTNDRAEEMHSLAKTNFTAMKFAQEELDAAKERSEHFEVLSRRQLSELTSAKQEIARLKDESDHWRRAHKTLQDSANSRLKELEAALSMRTAHDEDCGDQEESFTDNETCECGDSSAQRALKASGGE